MAYNLSRMTIYAMLSALEEDLRSAIKAAIGEQDYISDHFDAFMIGRAKSRLEKDIGFTYEDSQIRELVDYLDLGDTFQLVNSNSESFRTSFAIEIKSKNKELEALIPIRNRVMHIRPLDFEDLPRVASFCTEVANGVNPEWTELRETLKRIETDPSFVLGLSIPTPEATEKVSHNLPLPDFDETGLIGRDAIVKQVKKLCLGSFPVISIVGEGGLGKSALALKVAYELLEDDSCPFDAIIWVTSKTMHVTANEIRDIRGAITTSMGVVNEISSQLGANGEGENVLAEVVEYLATFKIALFIDNLETVMDDTIRQFVGALPEGSKIVITSRIGLGAYEYPIKLGGIEEKYASQFLRMLGRLRGVLQGQDEVTLRKYANRMHLSPGYMKWFVSALQTGLAPEVVLQNSSLFLEFCMSNVYEYLSADARELTSTMQCAPGWKDVAELSYLSGFEALRIQRALQELLATNMLVESSKALGGAMKTTYQLAELAKAYLNKQHRPSNAFQQKIRNNRNKLNAIIESYGSQNATNRYAFSTIKIRSKSDRVLLKSLRDAFQKVQQGQYDIAYELLDEARRLAPDYFEVHRILAFFHQRSGNLPEARESYELAITLSSRTPQLHYWFGKFILQAEDSADEAVEQFEIARQLDPTSTDIALSLARGYMFQHRFSEVHKILSELHEKIDGMSERIRKIYFDTRIQVLYRQADDYCQAMEYGASIKSLRLMQAEFNDLPIEIKDTYLRGKLSKASVTIQRLARACSGADLDFIQEFGAWCDRESHVANQSAKGKRI